MKSEIKNAVKSIFASNTFEVALEKTRELRSEYIKELGVKSWNCLVTYYKNANIIPVDEVAEEEEKYLPEIENETEEDGSIPEEIANIEEMDAIADAIAAEEQDESNEEKPTDDSQMEEVEYMLYRNTGDSVEWFGHRENLYGLSVGDTARMIRMNNKGVSEGLVVASNAMTLDDVALYHRCYAVIIRMKRSYKEQLELAAKCLMNLPEAIARQYHRVPASDTKLTDYILNFKKSDK